MAEYTKIETARAIICDFCNQLYSDEPCEPADCDWLRMLEEDAADVAPVVRCKECKHCRELNRKDRIEEAYADGVLWCTNQSDGVWPDDFCSYGERKEAQGDAKAD